MTLAVARKPAPDSTPKAKRDGAHGTLKNPHQSRGGFPVPVIQRKPVCACGGGCPRCEEHPVQTKLEIGQPGDRYEQETTRVGDQLPIIPSANPEAVPPIVHEVLRAPGQPLDPATRTFMESRFSHDFSRVRVHTDTRAAESARVVNALAYTVGQHVVFGAEKYAPGMAVGRHLIAHELTHAIQQSHAHVASPYMESSSLRLSDAHDIREREAEAQALRIQQGQALGPVQGKSDTSNLQRQIASAAPPAGLACTVASDSPPQQDVEVRFRESDATLSRSQRSQVAAFVTSWRALGASDDIRVDGYASVDGPPDFNWSLSCERANVIRTELIAQGVPSGQITLFAHGESSEAPGLEGNRRVIISTLAPPPEPPVPTVPPVPRGPRSCATIAAVPGSPSPLPIGSRGGCGSGPDFTFFDFPTLPRLTDAAADLFRLASDSTLESSLRQELVILGGGAIARAMVVRFNAGTGGTLTHPVGSSLSTAVEGSGTFAAVFSAARSEVDRQVSTQASTCNIDWRTFNVLPTPRALPSMSFNVIRDTLQLQAVLGGTQGLRVFIVNFDVAPGSRIYTATLRFQICDDFGVDDTDLDVTNIGHGSPGLFSFWILQHERRGHIPFVNEVIVERPISGNF